MLSTDRISNLKITDLQTTKTTCKKIVYMVGFQNTLYKTLLVGFIIQFMMTHGQYNIKFVNAQQAKQTYKYKNIK